MRAWPVSKALKNVISTVLTGKSLYQRPPKYVLSAHSVRMARVPCAAPFHLKRDRGGARSRSWARIGEEASERHLDASLMQIGPELPSKTYFGGLPSQVRRTYQPSGPTAAALKTSSHQRLQNVISTPVLGKSASECRVKHTLKGFSAKHPSSQAALQPGDPAAAASGRDRSKTRPNTPDPWSQPKPAPCRATVLSARYATMPSTTKPASEPVQPA